ADSSSFRWITNPSVCHWHCLATTSRRSVSCAFASMAVKGSTSIRASGTRVCSLSAARSASSTSRAPSTHASRWTLRASLAAFSRPRCKTAAGSSEHDTWPTRRYRDLRDFVVVLRYSVAGRASDGCPPWGVGLGGGAPALPGKSALHQFHARSQKYGSPPPEGSRHGQRGASDRDGLPGAFGIA